MGQQISLWHNTNNMPAEQLVHEQNKAASQEIAVLEFFLKDRHRSFIAEEVWAQLGYRASGVPITSIRRAISNLVKRGKLQKTNITAPGLYGKPVHYYIYRN